MCNNSNNSITHSVKMADTGYYIIIYDNPADYKKLNAENINKLSGEEKKTLFNNLELFAQKIFENKEITRPEHWGGYIVKPISIEFWQGRANRLHDRFIYEREEGEWTISRLSP